MKNKDAAKVYMKEYYENNKSAKKLSQNDVNLQQFTRTWPSVTAGTVEGEEGGIEVVEEEEDAQQSTGPTR